jgi:hypothetical protein
MKVSRYLVGIVHQNMNVILSVKKMSVSQEFTKKQLTLVEHVAQAQELFLT